MGWIPLFTKSGDSNSEPPIPKQPKHKPLPKYALMSLLIGMALGVLGSATFLVVVGRLQEASLLLIVSVICFGGGIAAGLEKRERKSD